MIALVLFMLASVPTQPHSHRGDAPTVDFEVESLAKNLDDAVKVCSSMIVSTANKSTPYRPEQVSRQNGRLQDIPEPNAAMLSLVNPKFGPAKLARWFDPHANILMMSYQNTPYCRIYVDGTQWVNQIRPTLERLVQVDNFWHVQKLGEGTSAGERSIFNASIPSGGAILTITGFEASTGTIGVALVAE